MLVEENHQRDELINKLKERSQVFIAVRQRLKEATVNTGLIVANDVSKILDRFKHYQTAIDKSYWMKYGELLERYADIVAVKCAHSTMSQPTRTKPMVFKQRADELAELFPQHSCIKKLEAAFALMYRRLMPFEVIVVLDDLLFSVLNRVKDEKHKEADPDKINTDFKDIARYCDLLVYLHTVGLL